MTSSLKSPPRSSLAEAAVAPGYLDDIKAVVVRMHAATDLPELVRLLNEGTERLGAEHAYFATYVRDDKGFGPCRTLLACDPLWALEYERGGHFAADPWLEYAAAHSALAHCRDINVITDEGHATVNLAKRFGFESAIVVPTPAGGGSNRVGALVVGSPDAGHFEGDGVLAFKMAARIVGVELSERCLALGRGELMATSALTDDELRLLGQARQGLTSKDLARRIGCSDQAIDARFKRLLPKFRVHSRSEAVRLAADHGLI